MDTTLVNILLTLATVLIGYSLTMPYVKMSRYIIDSKKKERNDIIWSNVMMVTLLLGIGLFIGTLLMAKP